jgi:hypothetical protein
VNNVVPLGHRVRNAAGSVWSWIRSALESAWDWFTGLGQGAWLLTVAVLVVVGIGVAVVGGRHPDAVPCDQAAPMIHDMGAATTSRSAHLTTHTTAILHTDSTKLQAIARHAFGSDAAALRKAAETAGGAQVGHRFDPEPALQAYGAACDFSR